MIKPPTVYGQIMRPWFCVVVYLWALELQASYGADHERLLDRLADTSLILWTLLFWAGALSVLLSILAGIAVSQNIVRRNKILCKGILVVITGVFLVRWLYHWQRLLTGADPIVFALLSSILVLFFWIFWRHVKGNAATKFVLPTIEECFYFGALPILGSSLVILFVKITLFDVSAAAEMRPVRQQPSKNTSSQEAPNVVLIVADALRAQSMSLYGHHKRTTPFLEKLGKVSNVYHAMHANGTTTQTSLTTIVSGKHALSHGRLSREFPPYSDSENLLRVLRDRGYYTAVLTSNLEASEVFNGLVPYLSRSQYYRFNFLSLGRLRAFGVPMTAIGGRMYKNLTRVFPFLGYPDRTSSSGYADDSFQVARKILPQLPEPFFLFIHIHEPHDPHHAPIPVSGSYTNNKELRLPDKVPQYAYRHYPAEWQPVANVLKARYEESVKFLDSELDSFVDYLYDAPWSSNLLFVFTADHGESFEREYINHGEDLYESSTWVPLIIRFPKQREGRRISIPTQSADLAPTIVNTLGEPVPSWMNGRPLMPQKQPEPNDTIAVNFKHPRTGTHYPLPTKLAIWSGEYKLIVSCAGGGTELYDLEEDPQELVDVSSREMHMVDKLKHQLRLAVSMQATEPKLNCRI